MLVRLTYASRAKGPVTAEMIEPILTTSRLHNPANGITGILCYSDNIFVQAIEGSRSKVNDLYCRIVRDQRHNEVTLLDFAEVTERKYPSWSMARVKLDKVNLSMILKFSSKAVLDPFAVSGHSTASLLEELAATAVFNSRD